MKRKLFAVAAAGLALAGGSTLATATPAVAGQGAQSLAFSCSLAWKDQNTAAIRCSGSSFVGWARCKNGRITQGAQAASGTISYAYCTSVNSSLKSPFTSSDWGGIAK
ncbi:MULTISPECIES: hypothetical protein [Micromonospora]|uniref:Ig-like domain-containing protein n=1 Tax=Micromonospora humida TaxID=2809018 RepID=A0ABS2IM46_9ACTN|nr:hypothetical protein [Micromonospora humida]MBM7075426.1 hypothetical protein [Micromonospora humida]